MSRSYLTPAEVRDLARTVRYLLLAMLVFAVAAVVLAHTVDAVPNPAPSNAEVPDAAAQ